MQNSSIYYLRGMPEWFPHKIILLLCPQKYKCDWHLFGCKTVYFDNGPWTSILLHPQKTTTVLGDIRNNTSLLRNSEDKM